MPKRIILIFGLGIVLFTVLVLYLFRGEDKKKSDRHGKPAYVSDDWDESYLITEKKPTGTYLFNELLEYRTKKTSTRIESQLDSLTLSNPKTSYFFIGNKFQLTTDEFDSIIERVKTGSNLFLAYKGISNNMYSYFFNESSSFLYDYNEYVDIRINNKNLRIYSLFQSDSVATAWNLFPYDEIRYEENDDILALRSLSEVKAYSNFLDITVGKGHVYLHSNPELFQNYQLITKNGFEYSSYVTAKIPADHQVKWLELGRMAEDEEFASSSDLDQGSEGERDSSFLQFIFRNKALTLALLLTLFGIILFLIFRTKRNQHIVPYIPKTANHSLSFAETIKEIYYKQQTPYNILQVMRKNFYVAVNKQFFIDISKEDPTNELKVLAEKSGIPLKDLTNMMVLFSTKKPSEVDFTYLQQISGMQQQFYRDSGIIKSRSKKLLQRKAKQFRRNIIVTMVIISGGIFFALAGVTLLVMGSGTGIFILISGLLTLVTGLLRISKPILRVTDESITFSPTLHQRKKEYVLKHIVQVASDKKRSIFLMSDGKKFNINHVDMSHYDHQAFKEFITPYLIM